MNKVMMESKVLRILDLEAQIKELSKEAEALKDELKKELTRRKVEEVLTEGHKIRWTLTVSNRFDSARFYAQHKDLYEEFSKPTESRRFSIGSR